MTESNKSVATKKVFDSSMLDSLGDSDMTVRENPFSEFVSVKAYNPIINTPIDKDKANKFKITESDKTETFISGKLRVNIIASAYIYSGEINEITENGGMSLDRVFVSTNEVSMFAKKSDPICLTIDGKLYGKFIREDFEKFIQTPMLNGTMNPFYAMKKKIDGTCYHGSNLKKQIVVYGKIVDSEDGKFNDRFFRMYMSPSAYGKTFANGEKVSAEKGSLLAAVDKSADDITELKGKTSYASMKDSLVDISIKQNEKQNFLLSFEYNSLVGYSYNNIDDVEKIKILRDNVFKDRYENVDLISAVIDGSEKSFVKLAPIAKTNNSNNKQELTIQQPVHAIDAQDMFDDTIEIGDIPF